jgi:4-cresol dehydrogenase (hydroxylating) flavoprotein subunit
MSSHHERDLHTALPAAIAEWRTLLGDAWIDTSAERCTRLELATFRTRGRVLVHLCPGNVEEVVGCLRIANRHGVPISAFSRGKNYGYSSSGPGDGATAALELSRLTAITEFDEELGYVRIQAGVTFAQLGDYLAERGSARMLPSTGGPADGSILANTIERGHGLGYGGNRYSHSCRYEVITARGERFETGFGRFENSRVANLMRTGVGPALDGLFTQSSLGVVTAITLWLPRRPRFHATILLPTPSRDRIGDLFDCVGEASRQNLIRDGGAFAMGAYKLASLLLRREDFTSAGKLLTWDDLRLHSRRWGNAQWFLVALADADSKRLLRAKTQAIRSIFRSSLQSKEHLVLMTSPRVRLARAVARVLPAPAAEFVRRMCDVMYERSPLLGHRVEQPLRTVYWTKPKAQFSACQDPHADGVGLIWVSVPVPLRGKEITEVCRTIDDGLLAHGFEPSTQVTLVSERVARVITALMYDRSRPESDERALQCQTAVYDDLRRRGYYTYRLQPHLMDEYAMYGVEHQAVVARIRQALDPMDVLDPARYHALVAAGADQTT